MITLPKDKSDKARGVKVLNMFWFWLKGGPIAIGGAWWNVAPHLHHLDHTGRPVGGLPGRCEEGNRGQPGSLAPHQSRGGHYPGSGTGTELQSAYNLWFTENQKLCDFLLPSCESDSDKNENLALHRSNVVVYILLWCLQDVVGGHFDAGQAFVGELGEVNIWDRVLKPAEIQSMANCSAYIPGNVISWLATNVEVFGRGAFKRPLEMCQDRLPNAWSSSICFGSYPFPPIQRCCCLLLLLQLPFICSQMDESVCCGALNLPWILFWRLVDVRNIRKCL